MTDVPGPAPLSYDQAYTLRRYAERRFEEALAERNQQLEAIRKRCTHLLPDGTPGPVSTDRDARFFCAACGKEL